MPSYLCSPTKWYVALTRTRVHDVRPQDTDDTADETSNSSGAVGEQGMVRALTLAKLCYGRVWAVHACSAVTGRGMANVSG
jgi:hypothetical protein